MAVLAQRPVAGHDDGHRVGGAGPPDRALAARQAERRGDLGVAARLAPGYGLEFLPDPALEGGGAHVQRQRDVGGLAGQVAQQGIGGGRDGAVVVRDLVGFGKLGAQPSLQGPVVVAEGDEADALGGRGQQQAAERRVHDPIGDARAPAALGVGGGRHAELRLGALVDPAGRAVAGAVGGARDGFPVLQLVAEAARTPGIGIVARAQPQRLLEQALQVPGAQADRLGQAGQGDGLPVAFVDIGAGRAHQLQMALGERGGGSGGSLGWASLKGVVQAHGPVLHGSWSRPGLAEPETPLYPKLARTSPVPMSRAVGKLIRMGVTFPGTKPSRHAEPMEAKRPREPRRPKSGTGIVNQEIDREQGHDSFQKVRRGGGGARDRRVRRPGRRPDRDSVVARHGRGARRDRQRHRRRLQPEPDRV